MSNFLIKVVNGKDDLSFLYNYSDILAARKDMRLARPEEVQAFMDNVNAEHAQPQEVQPEEPSSAPEAIPEDDYDDMHWTKLRKAVKKAGGEYTTKEDAIAFLRSL